MEDEIGEEVHAKLMEGFGLETEPWAQERVGRTMERLNRVRLACAQPGACSHALTAEILWLQEANAFTLPGRYLYITRRLLERAASDEPVAFVLAHELAHHDLGHVRLLRPALERLGKTVGTAIGGLLRHAERLLYSPEQERAADAYALDLCLAAGYAPASCLTLFEILEAELLDSGDVSGVFGLDSPSALWEKLRGYPSLRDRKTALQTHLRTEYGTP
ncbi:M48 family metallopeptidase [Armatimonas rosea]|uniref:Putative Zn-dependent protease n=1 Tax=Armatimonas rosea TaxID=685828 RepID=A0A7W9W5N6_ARMRO|nr:M48 family metallopeptidase [Armatimonas rosea]MBB6048767.1 putative Zn-dependent protease [Armatimonas rosea]